MSSTTISSGISAFEILHDGRLAIASYNKNIYVHNSDGTLSTTLTDPNGIVSIFENRQHNNAGGHHWRNRLPLQHRDLGALQPFPGHTKQTTYLGTAGRYVRGRAKQGRVSFIDQTNFTVLETFTASGDIIDVVPEFTGQFFAIGANPTKTTVRYFDLDSDQDGVNDLRDAFPNDATQTEDVDGDGYGDNPAGNQPDAFPNDETQWADLDGDGYGDNLAGDNPDLFPNNADQWADATATATATTPTGKTATCIPKNLRSGPTPTATATATIPTGSNPTVARP